MGIEILDALDLNISEVEKICTMPTMYSFIINDFITSNHIPIETTGILTIYETRADLNILVLAWCNPIQCFSAHYDGAVWDDYNFIKL